MLFKYTGIDYEGNKIKAKIEASSLLNAKAKIKNKKIYIKSIEEDEVIFNTRYFSFNKRKINNTLLSTFSRDLSIYLKAGVSLINALKLLSKSYKKDKKLSDFFSSLHTFLDEGKNFYTALDEQNIFEIPEFYKQSIKISEDGGLLQGVLLELATFLKEQDRIKKQISQAMIYPMFILGISFLMVGFMLSFIVPKITAVFDQLDQELPAITIFVINLGDFFEKNFFYLCIFLLFSIFAFLYCLQKYEGFKYFIDKYLLKIPFFSALLELGELSRFSYMNSILMRSGIPFVQAVQLSSNILNNLLIKKIFEEGASKIVEGEKLSKILDNNKHYKLDAAFVHAIAIGEETSTLSEILNNLATLYNEANKDKINIFLSLLEPIFMLIVGIVIGFIVIAMLLPIFSMNIS